MSAEAEPLAAVALAISAYRSDEQVIELLRKAFEPGQPRFAAVIVVDSLGTKNIAKAAERLGWPVTYINADRNLGSAGNLDLRLRTAAELGLEWCFTVNHDGEVDAKKVRRLLEHGRSRPKVGAVYPQLFFSSAGGRPDTPRRSFAPYTMIGRGDHRSEEREDCLKVVWSSSNAALYRLDAIREGVGAWPELWMGYEDLALGWELDRRGWAQLLCTDVNVTDNYEFAPVRILGREVHLATKPTWYAYYHLRNLLLIASGTGGKAASRLSILGRMLVDVALITLYRDHKRERLRLLLKGVIDGLRGVTGKGPVP